ncbi:uncharacterized protein LOC119725761 [Patiria miniata]|uniref:DUF4773 domain-containing protein n=1 Tax=Patiria miniata TaxID=46514 RepID=A0A913ZPF1_PATMI|nr:uncharacterized protein LOC119725761 [Patiria miniata]
MRTVCVTQLVICIILASFAMDASAAEERRTLDEMHAELAQQLLEEEQAGITGEELAAKLRENRRELNEMEREVIEQLLEKELASMTGQELARVLNEVAEDSRSLDTRGAGCTVTEYSANCCAGTSFRVFFKTYNLNACVLAEYLPEQVGVHLRISVSGLNLLDRTVSAENPGDICVGVPEIRVVSLCLNLNNFRVEGGHFRGCFAFKPKAIGFTVATLNMGCIRIP